MLFASAMNSLAIFTCHAEPNVADDPLPPTPFDPCASSAHGRAQFDILTNSLQKNVTYQRSVAFRKENWITSFGATPTTVVSEGRSDEMCQGIAAARALCAILKTECSIACFHQLYDQMDADGSTRRGIFEAYEDGTASTLNSWGTFFAHIGRKLSSARGNLRKREEMSSR